MNTQATHTPGPWIAHFPFTAGESGSHTNRDRRLMVLHPDGERLSCRLDEGFSSPRKGEIPQWERDANARLIAAAPELLSMLVEIIANAGYTSGEAIPELTDLCVSRKILDRARAAIAKATATNSVPAQA